MTFQKTVKKSKELGQLLSLPVLDGNLLVLLSSGVLTLKTAPLLGVSMFAGPVAFVMAASLGGSVKENVIIASIAGLTALGLSVFAAAIGSQFMHHFSIPVLKICGGVAVIIIGLIITGLPISDKIPVSIIFIGFILAKVIK